MIQPLNRNNIFSKNYKLLYITRAFRNILLPLYSNTRHLARQTPQLLVPTPLAAMQDATPLNAEIRRESCGILHRFPQARPVYHGRCLWPCLAAAHENPYFPSTSCTPSLGAISVAANEACDQDVDKYGSASHQELVAVYPAPTSIALLDDSINHGLCLMTAGTGSDA